MTYTPADQQVAQDISLRYGYDLELVNYMADATMEQADVTYREALEMVASCLKEDPC